MADIRTTGTLDDFERPSENPLDGGRWDYLQASAYGTMQLDSGTQNNHATRTDQYSLSYYAKDGPFEGDVEVWGFRFEIGSQIGHNEQLWLLANDDPRTAAYPIGYSFWSHTTSSGNRYYLFRYNANGTRTQLLSETDDDRNFVLLRRNGTYIEIWDCPAATKTDTANFSNWTRQQQVTDTTFTGALWLGIGEADNGSTSIQSGWTWFGGTRSPKTTLPQIIRRTHRRGGFWHP